jgi:3-dehydroquinate dehydratase/shikimate dehydrogenase
MSRSDLCATVAASTTAELIRRRDAATAADLIELRLDSVRDPDPERAIAGRPRPVIVTCRPRWEGGGFSGSEAERMRLLARALDAGAEFIDVEWRARFDDLLAAAGRRAVLSTHEFEGTPPDLEDRVRAMRATPAGVIKVAVTATRLTDLQRLLALCDGPPARSVLLAMGAAGLPSRILAARFGSRWTYAGAQAPGQLSLERMLGEFRFRDISDRTAVFGVVGRPVAHSLSPAMHNAGFAARGLDAVYVPFEAADAADFVTFAEAFGVRGASVTAPFKEALAGRVARRDGAAETTGAVNTLARDNDDAWSGANTDVPGFLAPLEGEPLGGRRVAVLGSGGAARAVVVALQGAGARPTLHARDRVKAESTARRLGCGAGAWPPAPDSWDVLVHATPAGTWPALDETPLPEYEFRGGLVYDLVYNPAETRLMKDAAAAGCRTLGGLPMLVAQAERQFRIWTGSPPPGGLFRRAALERLGELGAADRGRAVPSIQGR